MDQKPIIDSSHLIYLWVLLGILIAGIGLYVGSQFIGTFITALFLYYTTRPFYRIIKKRLRKPTPSAILSMVVVALPIIILASYTASIAVREVNSFVKNNDVSALESFLSANFGQFEFVSILSRVLQSPKEVVVEGVSPETAKIIAITLFESITIVGNFLLHIFIVLVVVFYLLRDGNKIVNYLDREFNYYDSLLYEYMMAVDYDFHKVFFGNILNAVITGVIGAVSFSLVNVLAPSGLPVPYPTLIGLLCGVASLIPVVGMKLVYFPISAYLFISVSISDRLEILWFPIVFFIVSAIIVDSIPDLLLRPYISGKNLHVGALMIAYIVGPLLFGWYGLFLAPAILVLVVEFMKVVVPQIVGR